MAAGNTYVPIATLTTSGGEASISFTSIPGTYTDLVLQGVVTSGVAYELFMRYNSDTGTNYSNTYMEGNGTSATSARSTSTSLMSIAYSNNSNPNPMITQIQNYSNTTTYKTMLSRSSAAGASVMAFVGLWRNTAAITSIELRMSSGGTTVFAANTVLSLYGIAAA